MGTICRAALACAVGFAIIAAPARAETPATCPDDPHAAVACFVNAARAEAGLRPLRPHPLLAESATRYAERMADERFFAHTSPEGDTFTDRLLRVGYGTRRADRPWSGGEALGLATGSYAMPQLIVIGWLTSPSHRRLVLGRGFRHLGVGIAERPAAPGELAGQTYVLHIGRRAARRR